MLGGFLFGQNSAIEKVFSIKKILSKSFFLKFRGLNLTNLAILVTNAQ